MQLIKKLEINYLRSLYSAVLDKVGDLNVIFGRNDSGKSNLLRALNLFFNETVEQDRWPEFDIDMSDHRRKEAREAKGKQFIWIKITFTVPDNYQAALGKEIAVKRQWNRDGDMTQTVFPPLETAGKQARLTRFLNDIDFTYIPAIKDLGVYADLIERMYGAAAETDALRTATTNFVDAIELQTTSLSQQLIALFGGPARLAPPTEMSKLFRNLDFAHGADQHSLLRQKGDGIKARHLPELLRFINEREPRKRLFLWGFEEPENSLDLGAAEQEASRFANFSSRIDTQIFITSHSPAFYLARNESEASVRRFFITKQVPDTEDIMTPANAASRIDDLEEAELRMENAGLLQLPYVIRKMSEHRDEVQNAQAEAEALRAQISELNKPCLFVEGDHDVRLFKAALERAGVEIDLDVRSLGGTPQTTDALLSAVLAQGGLNPTAPAFFLFDDDKAGRGAARRLCKSNIDGIPIKCGDRSHVWVIPRTDEFKLFLRRRNIHSDQAFFTAEFMFPSKEAASLVLAMTEGEESAELAEWRSTINGDYWPSLGQKACHDLAESPPGSVDWFFARGVPSNKKQAFAAAVLDRNLDTSAVDVTIRTVLDTLTAG